MVEAKVFARLPVSCRQSTLSIYGGQLLAEAEVRDTRRFRGVLFDRSLYLPLLVVRSSSARLVLS